MRFANDFGENGEGALWETHGHTWLHPECWNDWHENRRRRAQQALEYHGIKASFTD